MLLIFLVRLVMIMYTTQGESERLSPQLLDFVLHPPRSSPAGINQKRDRTRLPDPRRQPQTHIRILPSPVRSLQ